MIEIQDLSVTCQDGVSARDLIRDMNLTIGDGEYAAVTGPSGCGKSTLIHLLAGLVNPSHGRIVIDGDDLTGMEERALERWRRGRVGIVFQAFHLIYAYTVCENVLAPLLIMGVPGREARGKAAEILERVGMSHRLNDYPQTLSGGEQQRCAIARALVIRPSLILADEPTGQLDQTMAGRVLDLFDEVHRSGATILMVTHDAAAAARAQRIISIA